MTFMVGVWCVMSKDERRSVTRLRTIEVENLQIEVQVETLKFMKWKHDGCVAMSSGKVLQDEKTLRWKTFKLKCKLETLKLMFKCKHGGCVAMSSGKV